MSKFDCHIPDDYLYCRRCGLLTTELPAGVEPCTPPLAVLVLVNRRIASIVLTNAMENDVQWAIRSLTDNAIKSRRDKPDAAR